jgi:RNA polymerase sigma factor (sigma-70 family)
VAKGQLRTVLSHIRRVLGAHAAGGLTDQQLLESFSVQRDDAAFAALVQRHGGLVWGVCWRALHHTQDAEDVFQATFLVLARKAGSVRWQNSVGNWLYEVAYRLATKAKAKAALRRVHELRAAEMPRAEPVSEATWRELCSVLDEELRRLPMRFRTPLLLCYLQGRTRDQAAQELGCSLRTLDRRLERGRELLRIRLTRRGVTLSAALLATGLSPSTTTAAVPALLAAPTVKAATAFAAKSTTASGLVSAGVAALAEGGLKAMLVTKLKVVGTLVLVLGVLVTGAGLLSNKAGFGQLLAEIPRDEPKTAARTVEAAKPEAERALRVDRYGDPLPEGAIARVGTNRLRTHNSVAVIAFSQDGRRLAYGSENGQVHVCEAADGKPLLDVRPDNTIHPITELAFSPDGRILAASGYWSQVIWLIDVASQKIQHTIPNAAVDQGRWARAWQGQAFSFSPDSRTLIVGGKDGALHLWDIVTNTEQAVLSEEKKLITSLTLTADGRTALTAHYGGGVHLWDVTNRKHLRKLAATAEHPHFTAVAPDGKTVALAMASTELELWDLNGGRLHQMRSAAPLAGLGFTPDGASLLVADGNGSIAAWDVRTGKSQNVLTCEGVSQREPDARMGPKPSAWFRPDAKGVAWAINGTVRPWDLATRQETPRLDWYRQGIGWAGFSADGRLLRAGGQTGELGVWDAATGQAHVPPRKTDLSPDPRFLGLHCTPALDRGMVVVVTPYFNIGTNPNPREGRIYLWDPAGDAGPTPLREQVAPVRYAALTPDNRFIVATEASGQIRVYDAATGKPARSFEGRKYEYRLTFSPDGTLLATTGSDGAIRLYDFATGRVLRQMNGLSPVNCVAVAPDGRSLASGHITPPKGPPAEPGDMIYLWDSASGRELRRIPTGHHYVRALSFSPDGRLIASCGSDRIVHLWEASSGQERRRYEGHRSWVESVDFVPDGLRLASASSDGTALVWQVFDPAPRERSAADLDALWTDLAKDGITAHRAMAALIAAEGTAAVLSKRVKPAVKPSPDQLRLWLADLSSPAFKTREAAHREIARTGELVEPALRRALETAADKEVQRRLTDLLDRIPRPETRPEQLRDLRAVEVIEHLESAEARRLLEELTKGAPEARLTREAKAALERLARRPAAMP